MKSKAIDLVRKTKSLSIRPFTKEDESFWKREDKKLVQYIHEAKVNRANDKEYQLSIFNLSESEVLGSVAVKGIVREPMQSAYIEISVETSSFGDVLYFEVMAASMDMAFYDLGLHRVEILRSEHSPMSKLSLGQFGLEFEGIRKSAVQYKEKWVDVEVFSLTKEAYEKKNIKRLMQATINMR